LPQSRPPVSWRRARRLEHIERPVRWRERGWGRERERGRETTRRSTALAPWLSCVMQLGPLIGGPRMDLTERGDVLSCEPGEPRGDNIVKSLREWESLSFNSAEKDLMTQLQAATVSVDS